MTFLACLPACLENQDFKLLLNGREIWTRCIDKIANVDPCNFIHTHEAKILFARHAFQIQTKWINIIFFLSWLVGGRPSVLQPEFFQRLHTRAQKRKKRERRWNKVKSENINEGKKNEKMKALKKKGESGRRRDGWEREKKNDQKIWKTRVT